MTSKETKQYGLILPKKDQKKIVFLSKPSIFNDDSDESEEKSVEKSIKSQGLKNLQKRQTQLEMQRALEEDPTVYEYDSVFDSMQKKKEILKTVQTKDKKPKYINALLKSAEQRKKDYERRIERDIQKEREAEGNEFADKEAFVTSAYKLKMIEMQEEEERERKQNEIDARNDVMKQKDLSSFYRHMLKEKVGEVAVEKEPVKIKEEKLSDEDDANACQKRLNDTAQEANASRKSLDETAREALKKQRSQAKSKSSRNRTSSESENESTNSNSVHNADGARRETLKRNESDARINSAEDIPEIENGKRVRLSPNDESNVVSDTNITINSNEKENVPTGNSDTGKEMSSAERIRNLFKKRNVGEVFEAAKERYLARKQAKEIAK